MSKTLSAKYYQENKERLQKKNLWKIFLIFLIFQNLSKEENENTWQYGCEYYKNISENEKQKLVEYKKKMSIKKYFNIF